MGAGDNITVSMIWIINVITPTVKCEMSSPFSSLSSEHDLMLNSLRSLKGSGKKCFFHLNVVHFQ